MSASRLDRPAAPPPSPEAPAAAASSPVAFVSSLFRPTQQPPPGATAAAAATPAALRSPTALPPSPSIPPPRSSSTPVATALSETASRVVASAKEALGGRAVTVVVLALTAMAVGALIFVIVRWTINRSALQKRSALIAETRVPLLGTQLVRASGAGVPASANGRRRTMAFWLYVHDAGKFAGTYRHVFHRGTKDDLAGSPSVFLDKNDSTLYVRFKRVGEPSLDYAYDNRVVTKGTNPAVYAMRQDSPESQAFGRVKPEDDATALAYDMATHGIKIANFPSQRWVHVAVVLNEASNGGTITTYMDGEVVSQTRSGDPATSAKEVSAAGNDSAKVALPTTLAQFGALDLDSPGDVWIGGSLFETTGPGFSGLVSRIQFWNYDLNPRDVFDVYAQGPVDGVAAKLGLPTYGVRSPVYRLA